MLDADKCYAILGKRDPGADGCFFVAVRTTKIYCRPICPARTPLRRNVVFYRFAAEAQAQGFRPCLRCRPESAPDSPAWIGSLSSINRALALIDDGALADGGVDELADRLGMTARHLRRLVSTHLGVGLLAIERTRRVHLAKKLIHETSLSMTEIAFVSGFGSLRRFNETFQMLFRRPPSSLRGNVPSLGGVHDISLSLGFRQSLEWRTVLETARRNGASVQDDVIRSELDLGADVVRYTLAKRDSNTLRLVLADPPLPLIGKAIARVKRIHLSEFSLFNASEVDLPAAVMGQQSSSRPAPPTNVGC